MYLFPMETKNTVSAHVRERLLFIFGILLIFFFIFRDPELTGGKKQAGRCRPEDPADRQFAAKCHQNTGYGHQPAGQGHHSGSKMDVFFHVVCSLSIIAQAVSAS